MINNPLQNVGDLPIDADNESLIIANAIKDKANREVFVSSVDYRVFRTKEYQTIAYAIKATHDANMDMNVDAILLKSKSSPVRKFVDYNFIQTLLDNFNAVSPTNFTEHVERLHVDNIKGQIIDRIFNSLYMTALNPASDLSMMEERVRSLQVIVERGLSSTKSEFKDMSLIIPEYLEARKTGVSQRTTGFRQLDNMITEGLGDGQVSVIAGLPSAGKSSLALSIMKNLGHKQVWVAQFALEMPNMSLIHKLLAFNTQFPIKKIVADWSTLTSQDKQIIEYELERLKKNEYIYLNDKPSQTLPEIREQIMILQDRLQEQYIVIIIDLFGKISEFLGADNFARTYEQKLNEIQVMTRSLGVHMSLVAQINRSVMKRKFKRPTMADLKNAGAFEEVADLILGVHRPFYDPEVALKSQLTYGATVEEEIEEDPNRNIAEVIILKQRMGANNVLVNFYFDPETTRLSPIDAAYQETLNATKFQDEDDYWND